MKKYLLLLISLYSFSLNASQFDEAFDMSANGFLRQANRVVLYSNADTAFDEAQQKKELEFISVSLQEIEDEYRVNPVYWFVRGLHTRNMASFFQASGYDDKANSFLLEKNRHYQIAMKLDKNNEPHLSASAYAVMKSGLPESLKQQAIEAELNLGGSGESDTYYWYLHWSNVNELQKQGRFDEADVALQRMKNELAETGQKNTFDKLVKKIEKELKIKKAISENKKIVKKSPPKKAQQSARDHEAFTEEKVKEQYYRNLAVILIVMVVLAVIIFMFELKRRKRK